MACLRNPLLWRAAIGLTWLTSAAFAADQEVRAAIARHEADFHPPALTEELSALLRAKWKFIDAFGQKLALEKDEAVVLYAFPGAAAGEAELKLLCGDPEFPGDVERAEIATVRAIPGAASPGEFKIELPYFQAQARLTRLAGGVLVCRLTEVKLGPAKTGGRYLARIYAALGTECFPFWLAPDTQTEQLNPSLFTQNIGGVFLENETAEAGLALWTPKAGKLKVSCQIRDYASKRVMSESSLEVSPAADRPAIQTFKLDLDRFGVFEVIAQAPGLPEAKMRVCRLPAPQEIAPEQSFVGMNVFQQQLWWYAYQVPLLAKAGVHWIRPWLAWENTWQFQEPAAGQMDTGALDAALRRVKLHGLEYQMILWGCPAWLSKERHGCPFPAPELLPQWTAYVEKMIGRYKDRIKYWEIWNEPDLMWSAHSQNLAADYSAMLKQGYAAAKRADPDCVVLGLSHANIRSWYETLWQEDVSKFFDIATYHSYADSEAFVASLSWRQDIMRQKASTPRPAWINELGCNGYDFPSDASRFSELEQAARLPKLYALAKSLDPQMKAFWFCSVDPRNPVKDRAWDAPIGIIYLGHLPKMAYASLAAMAKFLDGRDCRGVRSDPQADYYHVAFSDQVALLWRSRPGTHPVDSAVAAGCAPEEEIAVFDLFGNPVGKGRADELKLDFASGPLYVFGSRRLESLSAIQAAVKLSAQTVRLRPGEKSELRLTAPAQSAVTFEKSAGLPVDVLLAEPQGESWGISLQTSATTGRWAGEIWVKTTVPPASYGLDRPVETVRPIAVQFGALNLLSNGRFSGALTDWGRERGSPVQWDEHDAKGDPHGGALCLMAPFDNRLTTKLSQLLNPAGPAAQISFKLKSERIDPAATRLNFNLAIFGAKGWLKTLCLASDIPTAEFEKNWSTIVRPARIVYNAPDWTGFTAEFPAALLPPEATHCVFFIDAKGGSSGTIWLDDIDLWQPEA